MKKTIAYVIVAIAYFILIYTLPSIIDVHPLVILIGGIIIYFLGICAIEYFFDGVDSEEKLEKSIMKKLRAEGYKCEKDEGELTYRMNGRTYRAHFWQSSRKEFRTAIVDYAQIDEEWENISMEGQSVLANAVNIENPHTTFTTNKHGVVCAFFTSVSSANDFLMEIKRAYQIIGETIQYAESILPQIKRHYPTKEKEKPIGFAQSNNSQKYSNIFNQQS